MILATYVLNSDGSVPEFVFDGGYFPYPNENDWPSDLTLVGWVRDDAAPNLISPIDDLSQYLISIGAESWRDEDGVAFDIPRAVSYINSLAI